MKAKAALAALLLASLVPVQASGQCTALLSWIAPTERTDGTPLTDLDAYRVYWGTATRNYPNMLTLGDENALTFNVTALTPGIRYFFAVTAIDTALRESAYSNEASKDCPPQQVLPDPRPPGAVAVQPNARTVYDYVPQRDDTLMLPVGTAPEGTQCLAAQGVIARGVVYFAVPRASVTFAGNVRPDIVYARCN